MAGAVSAWCRKWSGRGAYLGAREIVCEYGVEPQIHYSTMVAPVKPLHSTAGYPDGEGALPHVEPEQ